MNVRAVDPSATGTGEAPEGTASTLEFRDVSKHFGGVTALAGVSLTLRSGEVLALCGDNGAGKSTVVKIISGIESPDGGSISMNGAEVSLRSPHDAQALGIQTVYQDLALCDNLDTVQNMFLGHERYANVLRARRLLRPAMEQRAQEVLASLNVKLRRLDLPVGRLSGGQRQSVAISRSVLSDPTVVLLDEPTAALGVAQRREVLNLIDRLREQGRAVMVISHDLVDVLQFADRVVVLRLGRRVAEYARDAYTREDLVAAITGVSDVN